MKNNTKLIGAVGNIEGVIEEYKMMVMLMVNDQFAVESAENLSVRCQ